ncbi:MAG: hypothetical protein JWO63_1996, partial [Frankiales bacterium]|nr:hypothetical protein [Frankiales bacterium]
EHEQSVAILAQQVLEDRAAIAALRHQGDVDRILIDRLQAQSLLDRDQIANLQLALHGARRIGAAIGVLMSSHRLTQEAAFETLKAHSQRNRLKLRDVAETILFTGTL